LTGGDWNENELLRNLLQVAGKTITEKLMAKGEDQREDDRITWANQKMKMQIFVDKDSLIRFVVGDLLLYNVHRGHRVQCLTVKSTI
jgi:hypothetical protein